MKYMVDMSFNEFHEEAARMLADAVIKGGFSAMSTQLHTILGQAADNKVWGGRKDTK